MALAHLNSTEKMYRLTYIWSLPEQFVVDCWEDDLDFVFELLVAVASSLITKKQSLKHIGLEV